MKSIKNSALILFSIGVGWFANDLILHSDDTAASLKPTSYLQPTNVLKHAMMTPQSEARALENDEKLEALRVNTTDKIGEGV